jgi:hypothetical protein
MFWRLGGFTCERKEEKMKKTVFKGLLVVLIALAMINLTVTESHAGKEWGNYCWQFSHPAFDDGNPHLLILAVTQHGSFFYSLHGADDLWHGTVDGNAYYSPAIQQTVMGLTFNAVQSSPSYDLGCDLNPTTLDGNSCTLRIDQLGETHNNVDMISVPCPSGPS